jgi:hypothetical protein
MTPVELARQECANYNQGACLGVTPDSLAVRDDQPMNAHPLPECVLYLGQPCAYFERCVLPMANRGKPELIQAREIYHRTHAMTAVRAKCPTCGAPRAPRKRFCVPCAREQRRATLRDAQRRKRVPGAGSTVAMSTVKPENTPASN